MVQDPHLSKPIKGSHNDLVVPGVRLGWIPHIDTHLSENPSQHKVVSTNKLLIYTARNCVYIFPVIYKDFINVTIVDVRKTDMPHNLSGMSNLYCDCSKNL